jgi:type VI secretion system secreted protein VgrG
MRVRTPLPADTLLLEQLSVMESVSKPFEITLQMLSSDATINPKGVLGKDVTVSIDLADGEERYFHGLVRRFVQRGRAGGFVAYEATVVPTMWFLSLSTNCRIFQAKSVPEIVKAVLDDSKITDYRLSLVGSYPKREYCVQYRESDFDFISRLLEEEGIFYFFEHTKTKHTLVLADSTSAVKPGPVSKLAMSVVESGDTWGEYIDELEIGSGVASGKVTLVDYVDTETKRLQTEVGTKSGAGTDALRLFDYPGQFVAVPDGERLARIRLEEAEVSTHVVTGRSNCRALGSGQKLDVTEHYRRDANGSYHLLSLSHEGRVGAYRTTDTAGEEAFNFETSFVAIPFAVPFRPERTTPKSIVHGSQTAVVVGPSGEEIYVDKYGRVKVQFFWDREGKHDEKSSCWVRVSSSWAGKQWGAIQIPRIGQEVIVDFLEGDPDRPIITGRVYNSEQMPPYALPDHGTQSGVKSRSAKQGSSSQFNELRFEDMKDCEEIFVHAQKDLKTIVLHDETREVRNNRTTTISYDETKTITDGKEVITLDKGDQTITLKQGSQTTEIYQDHKLTIKMGDSTTEVSMGNQTTTVKMGNISTKVNLGSISGEAMQGIELKVGQNSVKIDQTGITIKGLMVKIEGQIQTEVKGLMTQVSADAMLMVKGSITMIN